MNIDWSKAPEGFPVWIESRYKNDPSDWHRQEENCFIDRKGGRWDQWQIDQGEATAHFKPEWDGRGLPPVGAVCEWKEKTGFSWVQATVLFITESSVVMQRSDGFEWQMLTKRTVFRPVLTPEQIAADRRLHDVRNALTDINSKLRFPTDAARGNVVAATVEAMIDAGYRKFEIVEEDV